MSIPPQGTVAAVYDNRSILGQPPIDRIVIAIALEGNITSLQIDNGTPARPMSWSSLKIRHR